MPRQNLRVASSDTSWVSPWIRHTSPQAGEQSNIQCMREKTTRRAARPSVSCPLPRGTSVKCVRRPVSGLASLDVSPSQADAQWHSTHPHSLTVAGAAQAWRSEEHAPASRLTAAEDLRCGTLHDVFSLTAVDERANYTAPDSRRPAIAAESRRCQASRCSRKALHTLTGDAS